MLNSIAVFKSTLQLCRSGFKMNQLNSLIRCIQRSMASAELFHGEGDRYQGVTVYSNREECQCTDFSKKLEESINRWRISKRRTIWFKVYLEESSWVPLLTKQGFKYHHAKDDYVMMYLWLPEDEPMNIPNYAHTLIGVGGLVMNDKAQILVIREKYAARHFWKLPGGYVEPGENLIDAVVREVREETNILTEFESVIAFRHTHGRIFNCSDIYVVVSLRPISTEVKKGDQEIAEVKWMDVEEYLNHSDIHSLNKMLVEKFLEYKDKNIIIDCVNSIHQVLKVPFTFYSVKNSENKSDIEDKTQSG